MAATLLLGVSCQKQAVTSVAGEGDVLRTISVNLGDAMTKASSSLSGEGAIEDATLFVWQHNAETDETTLYQKAYAEASTFEFSLLFSDQTEYTYSINAWANMGELDAEPADGEVLFIGEEASGLQMKGSRSGIDQASAPAVTIDMKRYVGKITVAEVALEWTNDQNALQDFTLKSIYVANAGDKAEGATAAYNVGGAYVSSAMDAMLYSPVNSVIADGSKYETAQMMYAYGSGSTALVLECDLGGQAMYYHVPYEPEWNTHRVFRFTVRQAGADTPLGDLPEEAIEVSVITLNVLEWDADEQETDFGEAPAAGLTYNAVDLGLPSGLKWADRNVGAASPENAGLYFAWGETVGYTPEQVEAGEKTFAWSNYFDTTDGGSTFNKYNNEGGLTVLEAVDDAATVNMGSDWRMPTYADLTELKDNTTDIFIDLDGNEFTQSNSISNGNLKGVKFTGLNGNSIFIPAAGYCDDILLYYMSCFGSLWSSSLLSSLSSHSYSLDFSYDGYLNTNGIYRYYGRSVRGVCN